MAKSGFNMIEWIRIKNFALVEEADIEFENGFSVITGETGAGKSVILGTVGLLLGERADKSVIRNGTDKCEISAGVSLRKDVRGKIEPLLLESGIETDDGSIFIRRIITASSTRNFINDSPVSLQLLKDVGDYLIDVHGANEHQSLLKTGLQLELLDRYAHDTKELDDCRSIYEKLRDLRKEREEFEAGMPSAAEASAFELVASEIEKVNPQPGEDEEISSRHALAANSKQIMELSSSLLAALSDGEGTVLDRLNDIYRKFSELEKTDAVKGAEFIEKCGNVIGQIKDMASDIETYASRIELDEKEFSELEERLSALQRLKRRYGPSLEQVFEALENAKSKFKIYQDAEEERKGFDEKEKVLVKELADAARKLSKKRKVSAETFAAEVKAELKKLGFLKSEFKVEFSETEPGANGADRIEYIFSANPGEGERPLREIASSGEMSRVMLALKRVLAEADSVPVLVFDEIDVNIGGTTAAVVGEELKKLAKGRQVLCISHLAQVASQADRHYLVDKEVADGRTSTHIKLLDDKGRKAELARMLGGTKAAEVHAGELLTTVKTKKGRGKGK